MKTLNILSLATAAMAVVACGNSDIVEDNTPSDNASPATRTVMVIANSPQDATTRTSYTAENKMLWQSDDTLALVVKNSNGEYEKVNLTLAEGAGTTSAKFTGTLASGQTPCKVVYPASAYKSAKVNTDNTVSVQFTFPTIRTYAKVGSDFHSNVNSCNMYASGDAKTTENGKVIIMSADLKYLCGVIAIKVPYLPASSGSVIISSKTYKINGDMYSTDGKELATNVASNDYQLHDTIRYSGATAGSAGVFYFPVPTTTNANDYTLTATVENTEYGKIVRYKTTSSKTVSVAAGQINNIPLTKATEGNYAFDGYKVNWSTIKHDDESWK